MLEIKDLKIKLSDSNKEIVHGVSLNVNLGEIHLLNGKNGSGKSTIVNTIMGNPSFEVAQGSIRIKNEGFPDHIVEKFDPENIKKNKNKYTLNISDMDPNERSLAGIYLANQYPTEIPGVSFMSFLRLAYNNRKSESERLSVFKFKTLVQQKAALINYPLHLLKRNLNEGFSGGEKKKTEILQMMVLNPKYILLDEIDSGLDKNSVREVFEGLQEFKKQNPESAMIIITHYDRVFDYLNVDYVHEMLDGNLIN